MNLRDEGLSLPIAIFPLAKAHQSNLRRLLHQSDWLIDRVSFFATTAAQFRFDLPAAQELPTVILFARVGGPFRNDYFHISESRAVIPLTEQHSSAENSS